MDIRVLDVKVDRPEVSIRKDDHKKFREYLSKGFYVYDSKGVFVLRKHSKVLVTVQHEGNKSTINMKKQLYGCYGKSETEDLVQKFQTDLENGQAKVQIGPYGYYIKKDSHKEKEF